MPVIIPHCTERLWVHSYSKYIKVKLGSRSLNCDGCLQQTGLGNYFTVRLGPSKKICLQPVRSSDLLYKQWPK